ncbi:MAG: hypothetical protein PHG15_03775 [Acinetobacter sp.]|uniref:hypothetical protein n=1 Tax=Acinetobacter sp. TaxID=472 RepID=UPI00261F8781|nr:hypothetical protein [Acinetobacter sp.]MDD2944931.1 hypothetical protein [Acinetobacter sp.]
MSNTKYSDAIKATFERNNFPRYTMALVSNKSEQDIIDKIENDAQTYDMNYAILVPYLSESSKFFMDVNGILYKFAIAINEDGEFIHE